MALMCSTSMVGDSIREGRDFDTQRGTGDARAGPCAGTPEVVNNGGQGAGYFEPRRCRWSRVSMLAFFADLVVRTDEARRAFENHPKVLDAVANGMPLQRYRALLLELYSVVWYFNPVCAAAASRLTDTHQQVRYHLYEHMHEEMGHEQWVMNDLEAVGVAAGVVRNHRPAPDTLALNGYNHWCADRRHPCSVLGMMYVLEVIASVYGGSFADAIRESLLLEDDRGVSFISSHASMDVEHMAQLRLVLNTIEDEPAREAILESTIVNFNHFTRIVEAV
jgi:pyrroloquinoline quinone (PQQ) biosynthesis protein C